MNGLGNLLLIRATAQQPLLRAITDKSGFHQQRGNIRRAQHAQLACSGRRLCSDPTLCSCCSTFTATSYPTRCEWPNCRSSTAAQVRVGGCWPADRRRRRAARTASHAVRANRPFRCWRGGWTAPKRKPAGAAVWRGVGVDGDQHVGALFARNVRAPHHRDEVVAVTRQHRFELWIGVQHRLQAARNGDGDILFFQPARANGAGSGRRGRRRSPPPPDRRNRRKRGCCAA